MEKSQGTKAEAFPTSVRTTSAASFIVEARQKQSLAGHDTCTICLSDVSERAVAFPCNHLSFDFVCLVQWVQTSPFCPLCKEAVLEVQYDFRDVNDFKRYRVPRALQSDPATADVREQSGIEQALRQSSDEQCQPVLGAGLQRRLDVYRHGRYAQHVGSSVDSGYRDFSPATFSSSVEMQARARTFLRRELQVLEAISHDDGSGSFRNMTRQSLRRTPQVSPSYLLEYIVAVLRAHEPRAHDARAEELLSEFMPLHIARHLLHEITAWLRSPHTRLVDWDETVQYATGRD